MITRRLWLALTAPQQSRDWKRTVYFYMSCQHTKNKPATLTGYVANATQGKDIGLWVSMMAVVLAFAICAFPAVLISVVPLLCFAPFVILGGGTLSGLILASKISGRIVSERKQGRFDLIGTTPVGRVGLTWIVCRISYDDSVILYQIKNLVSGMCAIIAAAAAFSSLFGLISIWGLNFPVVDGLMNALNIVVPIFIFLSAVYIDLVQSMLLGGVIGLFMATAVDDAVAVRPLAMSAFLALQLSYYAVIGLLGSFLLPLIYTQLAAFELREIFALLMLFCIFVGGRDFLLWRLGGRLAYRLDVNQDDLADAVWRL